MAQKTFSNLLKAAIVLSLLCCAAVYGREDIWISF